MEQLERLDEIIANIKSIKGAQALIGIGTTGSDRERMDDYSDLDFFVIAEKDEKPDLLDQLDWLETPTASLVFSFKNTQMVIKFFIQMASMLSLLFLLKKSIKRFLWLVIRSYGVEKRLV